MNDCDKEIVDDKLTQADLIKLMLHNAQHMATREEVKSDIFKLETNIQGVKTELKSATQELRTELKSATQELRTELKSATQELRTELKSDIQELRTELKSDIQELRTELKSDIQELKTELKADINKINLKFDRIQWLIISTIVAVLLKEQIIGLFTS